MIQLSKSSYHIALLHMDGSNGSIIFADEVGKAFTRAGNAQIDIAQSRLGGASGLFDGLADYLTTPDHNDFYFGTGDFELSFFLRFSVKATFRMYDQAGGAQVSLDYSNGSGWALSVYNGALIISANWAWSPSVDRWYWCCLSRKVNDFKFFVDGVQIGSTVTDTDAMPDAPGIVYIAANNVAGSSLNGRLDELSVTKGFSYTPSQERRMYAWLTGRLM